jgi:hypothetical protein
LYEAVEGRCRVGTPNASLGGVYRLVALLAEHDPSLRALMRRVLSDSGFAVVESATALQLQVALKVRSLASSNHVFLVLSASLAESCQASLSLLWSERSLRQRPPAHLVLTYEFGTLQDLASPIGDLAKARVLLEKPFDLTLLQRAASDALVEMGLGPSAEGIS